MKANKETELIRSMAYSFKLITLNHLFKLLSLFFVLFFSGVNKAASQEVSTGPKSSGNPELLLPSGEFGVGRTELY